MGILIELSIDANLYLGLSSLQLFDRNVIHKENIAALVFFNWFRC